jgi:multidrug efflux pump subunit AcrA (membrane-fusion protein)
MGAVIQMQNMEPGYSFAPMKVSSPVRGVVSQIKVSVGTHCTRGQELATVIDPSANKVTIEIAAGDVNAIKTGMKGELLIGGIEKPLTVVATGVSPLVDPATGTSTVELKVIEKVLLTPGTIGQARFKANSRMGYVLPDSAVVYRGDTSNVRLVVDGRSKINPIKVGKKRNGNYEVLSGLKDNDVYIERASMFVADGDVVKIEKATK